MNGDNADIRDGNKLILAVREVLLAGYAGFLPREPERTRGTATERRPGQFMCGWPTMFSVS